MQRNPNNPLENNINQEQMSEEAEHDNIEKFTKAIQINPKDKSAYANRGIAYFNLEQWDNGIADYLKAIELDPENATFYQNLGALYSKQGQLEKAMININKALELGIEAKSKSYSCRGFLFYLLGKLDDAIENSSNAIALDPQSHMAYFSRGWAYYDKGELEKAKIDLAKFSKVLKFFYNAQSFFSGDTALHLAIRLSDEKIATFLLNKNIDQSIKNKEGATPIELACQLGHGKMVSLLVNYRKEKQKTPLVSHPDYESALCLAIQGSHYTNVEALLGINTSCAMFDPDEKGNVAIYHALANDNIKILLLLLKKLDINQIKRNQAGDSVIEIAEKLRAINCLKYLLQKEALQQMKQALPKKPDWFSRPSHIQLIEKELMDLEFDDHQAVNSAFDKIGNQLQNKPITNNSEGLFVNKFQEKFAVIHQRINGIYPPANFIYSMAPTTNDYHTQYHLVSSSSDRVNTAPLLSPAALPPAPVLTQLYIHNYYLFFKSEKKQPATNSDAIQPATYDNRPS